MNDLVATLAVVLGTALGVLSAVGIVRMQDVYVRLQVASKASSLGIALLMLGVAAHFDDLSVTVRALLVVVFLFLTAPVAAHVIGRAAYIAGVPLTESSLCDELEGRYDLETGRLAGPGQEPEGEPELEPEPAASGGVERPAEGEATGHP